MTELEFHNIRKPFYLDVETLLVKFPTSKHMNTSHAQWFSDIGYPYVPYRKRILYENRE